MGQMAEHGIDVACYSLAAWSGKHEPMMACLCGFSAHESSWEDVGSAMDTHLAETSV